MPNNEKTTGLVFDRKEASGIPTPVTDALSAALQAAQRFGSASGRKAPLSESESLMDEQKARISELLAVMRAEFSRRYEAGLELSRE